MENITENTPQENGLAMLFKKEKISEESALQLSDSFKVYYDQTNEWKKKATEFLNDPNISNDEKAKESRIGRLAMVKIRTGIEKTRKDLNEGDQQRISDRNAAAKVLTALSVPIEELLLAKEKEAEIAENNRKQVIKDERLSKLEPFGVDCTFFDLVNMPDQAFETLLENSRLAFEKKAEDEKKAIELKELDEKINQRKFEIISLGFEEVDTAIFELKLVDEKSKEVFQMPLEELMTISNENWVYWVGSVRNSIVIFNNKQKEARLAEENKLKTEKEKLERENALLQQQEKERNIKHNQTALRLQSLIDMNQKITYDEVAEMTDQEFADLYKEKKSEYEAEQNRIFIEKKKKERDEAMAKAEAERKAKEEREAELAPDKEKLKDWLFKCQLGITPNLGGDAHKLAILMHDQFSKFTNWATSEIEKLK